MITMSRRSPLADLTLSGFVLSISHAHDEKDHTSNCSRRCSRSPVVHLALLLSRCVAQCHRRMGSREPGGGALLWKKDGAWQLRPCGGDDLKRTDIFANACKSAEDAKSMMDELEKEEAILAPKIVAKFSTFEDTMVMDGSAGQPQ
jgi:hypothetical protein